MTQLTVGRRIRDTVGCTDCIPGEKYKRRSCSKGFDNYRSYIPTYHNSRREHNFSSKHGALSNNSKSFFSTQFVHTNNMGNMAVSANAWLLAAIAVPLTIITIATWWTWTHCKISVRPKVFRQLRFSNFKFPKIRIPRGKFPLRQRLENTEMQQLENMESGMSPRIGISQQSTMCQSEISPQTLCNSRQETWRTSLFPMEKQEE